MMIAARRAAVRIVLVVLLAALAVAMYHVGKEYSVLVDNGAVSDGSRELPAIAYGRLVIDGDEKGAVEIWEDDRSIMRFRGAKHTIRIDVLDEDDDSVISSTTSEIDVDFDAQQWMLSLPAAAAGESDVLVPNPMRSAAPKPEPDPEPSDGDEMTPGF